MLMYGVQIYCMAAVNQVSIPPGIQTCSELAILLFKGGCGSWLLLLMHE